MLKGFEDHSDKPLYRWKLLENGTVTKIGPITEYKIQPMGLGRVRYEFLFPIKNTRGYCNEYDLDVFTHSRIFSFDPDDSHALEIIKQALVVKRDAFKNEYEYAQGLLDRFIIDNYGSNRQDD